jgi:hypothetical protein
MLMRPGFAARKTAVSNGDLKIGCGSSKGLEGRKRLRD